MFTLTDKCGVLPRQMAEQNLKLKANNSPHSHTEGLPSNHWFSVNNEMSSVDHQLLSDY